jgi:hypothetical protein
MRTLRSRISSDIEVSQTHRRVFLYVASAPAAVQAEQAVRNVLAEHDVKADVRCERWNPISHSWTSHENLMNAERRKSAGTGRAAWQVRAGPSSHRELKTLARRLEADGFSVTRRWRYLFTGANCEDDTHALADRIRDFGSVNMRIRVQRVYDRPRLVHVPGQRGVGGGWYEADGEWLPLDHCTRPQRGRTKANRAGQGFKSPKLHQDA